MKLFKQITKSLYVISILLICIVPFFGMFLGWGGKSTENRSLSSLPAFFYVTEDDTTINPQYTSELTNYVAENFGFRQELVTADAFLKKQLFLHSSEPKVVIGKKDWYFFNETTADYTGASDLSERGIYRLKTTIDMMNEYSKKNNITMLFFAAPNKNSIYPQFMPTNVLKLRNESNLDRLNECMKDSKHYINVKSVLSTAVARDTKRDYYLKNDSHWNNLGALIAFNEVEDNLQSRIKGFDYIRYPVQDEYTETEVNGDLSDMLLPSMNIKDKQYDLGIPMSYSSDQPITNLMANDIVTTCDGRYYDAICYRDSFSNALIGIMSNVFAKVRYTRSTPYDLTLAKDGNYNIAIIELAERNLPNVLKEAPLIDALRIDSPKRITPAKTKGGSSVKNQPCTIVDEADCIKISGKLGDWANLDTNSDIFIELVGRDNKSYFYKAFPISTGDAYADDGFSIRISKYSLKNDDYAAYIHVGNSDKTIYAPLEIK